MRPRRGRSVVLGVSLYGLFLSGCGDGEVSTSGAPSTSVATTSGATTTASTVVVTTTTTPRPATTAAGVTTTRLAASPAPPPQVSGLAAGPGGGSDEVLITWPPLPDTAGVDSYKLYVRRADGTELDPATVTKATLGIAEGRLGVVDAFDRGPWTMADPVPGPRCYRVTAVSAGGVEGPPSTEACGSPVGG